jgi:excisionase family DNA binding protein
MLDTAIDKAFQKFVNQSHIPGKNQEQLLTQNETWEILRCSKSSLYKWKREGRIPFHRICGKVYFKKSEIEKLFLRN